MKKHASSLAAIKSEDLKQSVVDARKNVADLRKGVRLGDVQNYKMINVKKKELARMLTRLRVEQKESK